MKYFIFTLLFALQVLGANTRVLPRGISVPAGAVLVGDSAGIGTTTPAGTTGQYLQSQGTSTPPVWKTVSQGLKNQVTNGDAENGTTGWATYNDAAGVSPVDATGGSPVATWTASSSSPYAGTNSFLLTKGATNRQGDGASYLYTIDESDQAKQHTLTFTYGVVSGTFANGSPSTASDVTVWICDVTNNSCTSTPLNKNYLDSATTASFGAPFSTTFQTPSNSKSYQIAFHIGSTSASAYTLKFDDIKITPNVATSQSNVSETLSYTPTGSWSTNSTYSGRWMRVGDSIFFGFRIALSGAPNATSLTVNMLPPNVPNLDVGKLLGTATDGSVKIGECQIKSAGGVYSGSMYYNGVSNTAPVALGTASTYQGISNVTQAIPATFASGDSIECFTSKPLPITGWGASSQSSDAWDGRSVEMYIRGQTPTQTTVATTTGGSSQMVWGAADYDSHSGWATGAYRVKVPGNYNISGFVQYQASAAASGDALFIVMLKNGTGIQQAQNTYYSNAGGASIPFTFKDSFVAGDVITFRLVRTSGITQNVFSTSYINIEKVVGAGTITASDSIGAKYQNTAGTSVGTGVTTLTFPTMLWDSHGLFSSNTTYTARVPGKYFVHAKLTANTINGLSTNLIAIAVNGTVVSQKGFAQNYSTASPYTWDINDEIDLKAGDAVTIQFQNGFGSSITMNNVAGQNSFAIRRVAQ